MRLEKLTQSEGLQARTHFLPIPLHAFTYSVAELYAHPTARGAAHAAVEFTVHNEMEEYEYPGALGVTDDSCESIIAPVRLEDDGFLMSQLTEPDSVVGKLPMTEAIFDAGATHPA